MTDKDIPPTQPIETFKCRIEFVDPDGHIIGSKYEVPAHSLLSAFDPYSAIMSVFENMTIAVVNKAMHSDPVDFSSLAAMKDKFDKESFPSYEKEEEEAK